MANVMFEGMIFQNMHEWWDCQGMDYDPPTYRTCIIHRPTTHHMRTWPLLWRDDRTPGLFERLCPHGTGHPDPDQFDYWRESGKMNESIHGCDGCCRPPLLNLEESSRSRSGSTATTVGRNESFSWEAVPTVANPSRSVA